MFTSHMQEMGFNDASLNSCKKVTTSPDKANIAVAEAKGKKSSSLKESDLELSEAKLLKMWAEPVAKAMCSSKKKLKQNIVEVEFLFIPLLTVLSQKS